MVDVCTFFLHEECVLDWGVDVVVAVAQNLVDCGCLCFDWTCALLCCVIVTSLFPIF